LIDGKSLIGAFGEVMSQYNYEWLAGALVIFVAFIPFFAFRELNQVLGEGTLRHLFFKNRSAMEPSLDRTQNTPGKG
jgi:hypothetical protein